MVADTVASVLALVAILIGNRPADRGHPYGHGKIEFFSAAFEGGLISLASLMILYEAFHALLHGVQIQNLSRGLWINGAAGLCNGLLGWVLIRAGKRWGSHALLADGQHILADFYVTIGLALGLAAVAVTGLTWLDPLLAIGIGVLLIRTGFRLVRDSSDALLDSEDPTMIGRIVDTLQDRPRDIITVHELRAMRSGRYVHVDMHVVVPEFYEVGKAHDLVENFGNATIRAAGLEGECHTHVDPCRQLYCAGCAVEPCGLRQAPFAEGIRITPATATEMPLDN